MHRRYAYSDNPGGDRRRFTNANTHILTATLLRQSLHFRQIIAVGS